MRKIALFMPANVARHGDLTTEGREKLALTKAGIPHIGKSGVKVVMSFQEEDLLLYPEVVKSAQVYKNIEMLHAPFSHCLMVKMGCERSGYFDHLNWQKENRYQGNVNVSFFSEFYIPDAKYIPTEYFLVLGSQSYAYSLGFDWFNGSSNYNVTNSYIKSLSLKNVPAIDYENKIGLVMQEDWFGWFHKAFYRFQRDPYNATIDTNNKKPLDHLIDEIKRFAFSTEIDIPSDFPVIIPIDLEAPFVGSLCGAEIWKMFFERVAAENLQDVFVSLGDYLDRFKLLAVKAGRPHRDLGPKWTRFEAQLGLMFSLATVGKMNEREHFLFSLANASDMMSIMNRKIIDRQKPTNFKCADLDGSEKIISLSYDSHVFETGSMALKLFTLYTGKDKLGHFKLLLDKYNSKNKLNDLDVLSVRLRKLID